MRGAVHLVAIAVAALCAGCATSVDVSYDPRDDFSGYRTWDWLPRGTSVEAVPGEERRLGELTSRSIERELRARGLAHVSAEPDLLVGYTLEVRRYVVSVNETGATDLLSSHHASPSYLVQSTTRRVEAYDAGILRVMVTDGTRQRMLWRGELWARRRGDFARHLSDAVATLLEEFPAAPASAELHD